WLLTKVPLALPTSVRRYPSGVWRNSAWRRDTSVSWRRIRLLPSRPAPWTDSVSSNCLPSSVPLITIRRGTGHPRVKWLTRVVLVHRGGERASLLNTVPAARHRCQEKRRQNRSLTHFRHPPQSRLSQHAAIFAPLDAKSPQ